MFVKKNMKYISIIFVLIFVSCNNQPVSDASYYGDLIDDKNIFKISESKKEISSSGKVRTKIQGEILATCAKKGCWMDLKVDNDTLMVRFKDYGFFVPKEGVEGKTAIISGEIFYDTLSVELLRHYAEDAGKSSEEINLIVKPEYTLAFTAHGVIIK